MSYIDFYNLPKNNNKTWELLATGKTAGVFQLDNENLGGRFSKKIQPKSIADIAAVTTVIRPGTLQSELEDGESCAIHYERRHRKVEPVESFHPLLDEILKDTQQIILYQEQTIRIAKELAGFNGAQAMKLLKGIGKKKADLIRELEQDFVDGCVKNGILEIDAQKIFDVIKKSARYSFNKCFSADTKIRRPNSGKNKYHPTLEEMFNIRNDIEYAKRTGHLSLHKKWKLNGNYGKSLSMCEDGRIRPNIIEDIRYAGERQTWIIELDNGASVSATDNHKFPTEDGEKTLLEIRKEWPNLYVCGEYENTTKKYNWSAVSNEERATKQGKSGQDTHGKQNRWYTNGEFSKFIKNRNKLEDVCNHCGANNHRLECHHKDSNRQNNEVSNLEKLCPSCHKKEEYALGRTKRGEKEYPSQPMSIKSIRKGKVVDVYDVTMAAPNHNLVVDSGVVACNSHAVAYSEITYCDAYAKANHTIIFYVATLRMARHKQHSKDQIKKLVKEAETLGITCKPPRLDNCYVDFTEHGGDIYFGVSNIKGIGETKAQQVVDIAPGPPTWYQCLFQLLDVGKSTIENCILAGVFAKYKIPVRRQLDDLNNISLLSNGEKKYAIEVYRKFDNFPDLLRHVKATKATSKRQNKLDSIIKLMDKPPEELKDNLRDTTKNEVELFGCTVSYSNIDTVTTSGNCSVNDYNEGKQLKLYQMVVEVERIKTHEITKGVSQGKTMCFLSVFDHSGKMDVVLFDNAYDEFGGLLYEGSTIMLKGKRGQKKGLVVDEVLQII
jgi:hypothetical protein